jgi:hypothetical protein
MTIQALFEGHRPRVRMIGRQHILAFVARRTVAGLHIDNPIRCAGRGLI